MKWTAISLTVDLPAAECGKAKASPVKISAQIRRQVKIRFVFLISGPLFLIYHSLYHVCLLKDNRKRESLHNLSALQFLIKLCHSFDQRAAEDKSQGQSEKIVDH